MTTKIVDFFRWQNLQFMWQTWGFWFAIALACLGLEAGALFYQHVLKFYPCELCIYVRVWLTAIFFTCLLALYLRRFKPGALLCSLLGLGFSVGLANETYNLLKVEYDFGDGGACSFFPNFPEWAPLDQWVPFLFEVQELCAATPQVIFGISMADALAVVSLGFIAAFVLAALGALTSLLHGKPISR